MLDALNLKSKVMLSSSLAFGVTTKLRLSSTIEKTGCIMPSAFGATPVTKGRCNPTQLLFAQNFGESGRNTNRLSKQSKYRWCSERRHFTQCWPPSDGQRITLAKNQIDQRLIVEDEAGSEAERKSDV